jgi:hypothetical protein
MTSDVRADMVSMLQSCSPPVITYGVKLKPLFAATLSALCRYPQGPDSPTFLLLGPSQQQQQWLPVQSSAAMAATFSSSSIDYITLGKTLDKQLCFYGACSLAVLAGAADAELALAAVNIALREAHRCVLCALFSCFGCFVQARWRVCWRCRMCRVGPCCSACKRL